MVLEIAVHKGLGLYRADGHGIAMQQDGTEGSGVVRLQSGLGHERYDTTIPQVEGPETGEREPIGRHTLVHLLPALVEPGVLHQMHEHMVAFVLDADQALQHAGICDGGERVHFTTAFSEHAVEGFDLDVVDYLLKPFSLTRFREAIERVERRLTGGPAPGPTHITVRSGHDSVRLALDELTHVEGMDDFVKFHRTGVRPVVCKMTMKAALDLLPGDRFVRVHRSFIVDWTKVERVTSDQVVLREVSVPIGETYAAGVKERLREG